MSTTSKVNAAVIGVGYLGQWHARKLAAIESASLVAVVDSDNERASSLARELGCRAFKSVDELPGEVRAAVVAVPTGSHFTTADRLLERGIDVLVEKPFTGNTSDAGRIVEKAQRLKRVLAVGMVERMNPAWRAAAGELDGPSFIEARRLAPLKDRARSIDVVRDLMIHDIDLAICIAGSRPSMVEAAGAKLLTDKIDMACAWLKFDGGAAACITASRLHDKEIREMEVMDRKGLIKIDCGQRTSRRFEPSGNAMTCRNLPADWSDALEMELREFIRAVQTGTNAAATGAEALDALAVVEEIIRRIEGREGHHGR